MPVLTVVYLSYRPIMSSVASVLLWAVHQVESFAKICEESGIPGVAQAGAASVIVLNFLQVNHSIIITVPLSSLTLSGMHSAA